MQSVLQDFPVIIGKLSLAVTVLFLFYYLKKYGRSVVAAFRLPSVLPPFPITVYKLLVYGIDEMARNTYQEARKLIAKGVRGCVFWVGPFPVFFVCKPEDIQVVLNNVLQVGSETDFIKEYIGNGLLTCPVDIWRVTRRYIQPLHHPRNIEFLFPSLNKIGRDAVVMLSRHVGSGLVDVKDDMGRTALQSACSITFGPWIDANITESTLKGILRAINRMADLAAIRLTKVWLWPDVVYKILYKKERNIIDLSLKNFMNEIEEINGGVNVDKMSKSDEKGVNAKFINEKVEGYMTLSDNYQILQKNHPNFTDKDLRNEYISTLSAGIETSQMTLASCLLALAANPDIQEKLYDEIVTVVGSEDCDVTHEDLKHMPYLDQVLKETLRAFPVLPVLSRRTPRDLKLSFGTMPAGSTLCIMVSGVHSDPHNYPDPLKFDPDRFLPENVAQRHKYSHIPFLAGPRNCIGKAFAMTSIKIELIHMIKQYRFETNVDIAKIKYVSALISRSQDGYKMKIFNRT